MTPNPTKDIIDIAPISKEQLITTPVPPEQLWYIMTNEGPLGPFPERDLKNFFMQTPHFSPTWQVAPFNNMVWKMLSSWGNFREIVKLREDSAISTRPPQADTSLFYILQYGQKSGPFNIEEIEEMLEKKELLFNQLISTDKGESWIRVYEFEHFERRKKESPSKLPLPNTPNQTTFDHSESEAIAQLQSGHRERINSEESFLGLAQTNKDSLEGETATLLMHTPESEKKGIHWPLLILALLAGVAVTVTLTTYKTGSVQESDKVSSTGDSNQDQAGADESDRNSEDMQRGSWDRPTRSERWKREGSSAYSDHDRAPSDTEMGRGRERLDQQSEGFNSDEDDMDNPPPPPQEEPETRIGPSNSISGGENEMDENSGNLNSPSEKDSDNDGIPDDIDDDDDNDGIQDDDDDDDDGDGIPDDDDDDSF